MKRDQIDNKQIKAIILYYIEKCEHMISGIVTVTPYAPIMTGLRLI